MGKVGYLCLERAGQSDECYRLDRSSITLGSGEECLISLSGPQIATTHAEISSDDEGFSIRTIATDEIVVVNGQESNQHALSHGDQLKIGETQLRFEISEQIETSKFEPLVLLHRLAAQIANSDDTNLLLHEAFQIVFQSIDADRGCIFLYDEIAEESKMVSMFARASIQPSLEDVKHRALQNFLNSPQAEFLENNNGSGGRDFAQSIIAPMVHMGKIRGGIYVEKHIDSTPWDQPTTALLTTIASQLSVAVANQLNLAKLGQQQPKHEVGKALTSLEHQIRNIWQGFNGGAFIVQEGLTHNNLDLVRQGWAIVERDQNRLFELIDDVLSFNDKHEFQLHSKDLRKVVTAVINELWATGELDHSIVEWSPPDSLELAIIEPVLISSVLRIFIRNATDACQETDQPQIKIRVQHLVDEQVFEVVISDNGCGIAAERIPNLRSPFETTKEGRRIGIGLAYAQKCVEKHEGEIRVKSEVGQGSEFTLILPDRNKLTSATLEFGRAQLDEE